jgi:hypothetical protein
MFLDFYFVLFVPQIFENSDYQISGTNLQEQQEKKNHEKSRKNKHTIKKIGQK